MMSSCSLGEKPFLPFLLAAFALAAAALASASTESLASFFASAAMTRQ